MPVIENQVDSQFAPRPLNPLRLLETDSIHILREVASESGAVA
jgi:hypothetical protein